MLNNNQYIVFDQMNFELETTRITGFMAEKTQNSKLKTSYYKYKILPLNLKSIKYKSEDEQI
jgi:hypothetical protein